MIYVVVILALVIVIAIALPALGPARPTRAEKSGSLYRVAMSSAARRREESR